LCPSIELRKTDQQHQQQGLRPAAAAVELKPSLSQEQLQSNARYLSRRPDWLAHDRSWIDTATALELAAMPLARSDVDQTIADARRSRATLNNPAGFVVKRLRSIAEANAHNVPEALRR
jgi:hypothetical protein